MSDSLPSNGVTHRALTPLDAVVRCRHWPAALGRYAKSELAVILPGLVMLACGLYGIRRPPLTNDEHCTWWAISLKWPDFWHLVGNVDAVLAPYYLFMRGWVAVFGDGETSLRTPSTIAMVLTASMVGALGRRLVDARTGLVGGVVYALLPATTASSHDARPYAFSVAFVVLLAHWLLDALESGNQIRQWARYGTAIVLVALTHLVGLAVIFAHAYQLLEPRAGFPWRRVRAGVLLPWVLTVAAATVLIAPFAYLSSTQAAQLVPRVVDLNQLRLLHATVPKDPQVGYFLLLMALVAFARRRPHTLMLGIWALLPPLFLYVTYDVLHIFRARYLLFTLPAWSLLLAVALPLEGLKARWFALLAIAVAAVVLSVGLDSHERMRPSAANSASAYRQIAKVLRKSGDGSDAIVFDGDPAKRYFDRLGVAFAMRKVRDVPRDVLVEHSAAEVGDFLATECSPALTCISNDVARVWLLTDTNLARMQRSLAPDRKALFLEFGIARKWPVGKRMLLLLVRRDPGVPIKERVERAMVEDANLATHDARNAEGLGNE